MSAASGHHETRLSVWLSAERMDRTHGKTLQAERLLDGATDWELTLPGGTTAPRFTPDDLRELADRMEETEKSAKSLRADDRTVGL